MKTPVKILSILALLGVASFAAYKLIKGRKNNANNSVDDTADNSLELPTPPVITPTITATKSVASSSTIPLVRLSDFISMKTKVKPDFYNINKVSYNLNDITRIAGKPTEIDLTPYGVSNYNDNFYLSVGEDYTTYIVNGKTGRDNILLDFTPVTRTTSTTTPVTTTTPATTTPATPSTTTTTTTTTAKSSTTTTSTAKDKALAEIARLQKQMTVEKSNDNDVINLIPLSDYIQTWISPSKAEVSKKSAYPSTYRKKNYTFITSNPNSYTNWSAFGISNIPGYFDAGDSIWALSENPVGIANFFVSKSSDNTQKALNNAAASISTFSAYNLFDWFNKKNGGSVAPTPKLEKISSADVDDMGSSPNAIKWSNYNITDYPLAAWIAWDKTGKGFHFYAKKVNNKGTKNWYIVTEN